MEPEDEIRRGPAQKTIALFSKVTRVECSPISVVSSREGSMPLVAVPDEREIQKVNAASILQQEVTADAANISSVTSLIRYPSDSVVND